ncbi:hypothetical protein Hanom_Chr06g00556961 [Helianthus anomalus]
MNFALNPCLFDDRCNMCLCEGFFLGGWHVVAGKRAEGDKRRLRAELKTSQTVAAELRCRVTDVKRKLLEEKNVGALLEQRERAWKWGQMAWAEEKEELVAELKHQKELYSVSGADLVTMYIEWGMATNNNQSLERIYRAYRDVGYKAGLKDRYTHSSQGLKRKETPLYNSKAKKQLYKLDKEFGEKTHALLEKILERPLMALVELKALLIPAGPFSPKPLSGDASP